VGWTFKAFKTSDAVLLPIFQWSFFGDCTNRAFLYTPLTIGTLIGHRSFQNTETRKYREESPQWTKIATPESFTYDSQSKDDDQDDKDEEIDLKQGQWNGRYNERIARKKTLDLGQKVIEDEDDGRIKGDNKRPGNHANRVEDI
jgi:hypothetical protein